MFVKPKPRCEPRCRQCRREADHRRIVSHRNDGGRDDDARRYRHDQSQTPARQICDRRRRRDELHARLGRHDARSRTTWAVRNAIEDAGLKPSDVDGMLSYQSGDSTFSTFVAGDLGIRLNFYMDVFGGGSSTEALVGSTAMAGSVGGMCKVVVIFRAMNEACAHRRHGSSLRRAGVRRHARC